MAVKRNVSPKVCNDKIIQAGTKILESKRKIGDSPQL